MLNKQEIAITFLDNTISILLKDYIHNKVSILCAKMGLICSYFNFKDGVYYYTKVFLHSL